MPAWLLVYVIVFDVGTSDKEIRFDLKFNDPKLCERYATSKDNKLYMIDKYKNKGIRMVYPGCEIESRAMYLDTYI
jgi:hypothetical protein|tara:strand:- start:968 stop:1195 length:228 start_codon:yes stop_codon:yes gene_type:complete